MMRIRFCLAALAALLLSGPLGADTVRETVEYTDGQTHFEGTLFSPTNVETPLPAVLVVHEWWGQNEHARNSARRLAEIGYVALAVDMYGEGRVADHPRDAGEMAGQVRGDTELMRQRFAAADNYLRELDTVDRERVAAIGYCFGGSVVLEMARAGTDLAGVASFHGALATDNPARPGEVGARVLVLHGADDPLIPHEQVQALREEMQAAGVDYRIIEYQGATHSFTNPDADRVAEEYDLPLAYDEAADRASWEALTAFLADVFASDDASARLAAILDARSDELKARDEYRHPRQTLEFFGIAPGMTVVEALPGMGWYSQILVPYLGGEGRLIGANYAREMWPMFGFFDQDFIDSMATWTTDWPAQAQAWRGTDGASIDAFELGSMPAEMAGQADAVLLIRALHNLARFEHDGGFLTAALDETYQVLKPGGIVGVVQHEARPEMPDEWAGGASGYLKKQFVIDRMTEAGFEFVDSAAINENPSDRPGVEDNVWRLPPALWVNGEDPELRSRMEAIGESHRMTLKFRKPE